MAGRPKRQYTLAEVDEATLGCQPRTGVFAISSESSMQYADNGDVPRVRRIRVGIDFASSASLSPLSASSSLALPSSSVRVPMPSDAIMPGIDYGPCRICNAPLGNAPFVPYQLLAKFCAASATCGMAIVAPLEHNSNVTRVDEVDTNADIVFSIHLPPRAPYHCECSERCYILYRTACDNNLGLIRRVLASLGCNYIDTPLTLAEEVGVMRLRGRIAAGLSNVRTPAELGLTPEPDHNDVDMKAAAATPHVDLIEDSFPWQHNAASSHSSSSAPLMPGQYEPAMQSSTFSFGGAGTPFFI